MAAQSSFGIAPYTGSGPYLFVSYAHDDEKEVEPTLKGLVQAKYAVWWDKDLRLGHDWAEQLTRKMKAAQAALIFLTPSAVESPWVREEIMIALNNGIQPLIVRLKGTSMPADLEALIGHIQHIEVDSFSEAAQLLSVTLGEALQEAAGGGSESGAGGGFGSAGSAGFAGSGGGSAGGGAGSGGGFGSGGSAGSVGGAGAVGGAVGGAARGKRVSSALLSEQGDPTWYPLVAERWAELGQTRPVPDWLAQLPLPTSDDLPDSTRRLIIDLFTDWLERRPYGEEMARTWLSTLGSS